LHFRPKGSLLHGFCQWTLLTFGENCFAYAKILTFSKCKMSPPSWIFEKLLYFTKAIDIGWRQVYAAEMW
jgi:hypothetical protein